MGAKSFFNIVLQDVDEDEQKCDNESQWHTITPPVNLRALDTQSCRNINFVVTVGTGGCRYDNLWCRQWR